MQKTTLVHVAGTMLVNSGKRAMKPVIKEAMTPLFRDHMTPVYRDATSKGFQVYSRTQRSDLGKKRGPNKRTLNRNLEVAVA